MREIKFRALNTDNKGRPIRWEYGTPEFGDMGQLYILYGVGGKKLCQRNTLGQFTGLIDKNGQEIYEGDILRKKYGRTGNQTYCISYFDGGFSFDNTRVGMTFCQQNIENFNLVVIGNVYENPDLLS